MVEAESPDMVVVSVDMSADELTPASSVFGLTWQAATVSRLPTSRSESIFFMYEEIIKTLIDNLLELLFALFRRPRAQFVIHAGTPKGEQFVTEIIGQEAETHAYHVRTFLAPE